MQVHSRAHGATWFFGEPRTFHSLPDAMPHPLRELVEQERARLLRVERFRHILQWLGVGILLSLTVTLLLRNAWPLVGVGVLVGMVLGTGLRLCYWERFRYTYDGGIVDAYGVYHTRNQ